MRIAIDARLNAYRRGGIPQYTRQLATALAALERNEQFIMLQHREQMRPIVVAPNVQRHAMYTPPHHRFEHWTLPLELLAVRADVLHFPDFVVPQRRPCPAVVTVHDLAFMHYPEILDDAARRYYNQVRASVHRADAVIAVSQSTRDDIVSLLDLPAERIHVVYEAASPAFTPLDLAPGTTHTIGAHTLRAGTFALFVSTLEPRKNLPTLLKALRVCIDRRPETLYRLVVAGARGWRYKPIFETVRDLHLEDAVLFLDSVSDDDLRWLYSGCLCYANPSLYEGFALPPLEALACGAPTLVASTSSLPEVVGDAALLLPPLDVEAWADALELMWHDHGRRSELAARGPAQARKFSWQQAARQTMAIYREVALQRGDTRAEARPMPPSPIVAPPVRNESNNVPATVSVSDMLPQVPLADTGDVQRLCLRCGAALADGVLANDMSWQPNGAAQAAQVQRVSAWACAVCGYIELALAHQAAVYTDHDGEEPHSPTLARAVADGSLPHVHAPDGVTSAFLADAESLGETDLPDTDDGTTPSTA